MRAPGILLLFTVLVLMSCSDFNKAVKSNSIPVKLAAAEKYYAIGAAGTAPGATKRQRRKAGSGFERALPLLEELISLTRGDTTFERVSYLYAKSYFGIKDHILAGYYLQNFAKTFPTSRYAEECAFLSATCQYKESPAYELDQTATESAISQFQLFLAQYPNTELTDSCNTLIDQLRKKLEKKEHANAMQYLKTRHYEAAGIALRNFLKRWPNSPYRESVLFNILLTDHDLAVNSVEAKRAERLAEGLRSFDTFADAFPESDRIKEAQRLRKDLVDHQQRSTRTHATDQ